MPTDLEALRQELSAWAQAEPAIIAIYLYGSQAEGRASPISDVDVAVLAQPDMTRRQLWRLEDQWAAHWPEKIDLRVLNLAPLPFRYEVTAHGERLWAADVGQVAEVESLIWRQYWDLRPLLEQGWQQFVQHVLERKDEAERQRYEAELQRLKRHI